MFTAPYEYCPSESFEKEHYTNHPFHSVMRAICGFDPLKLQCIYLETSIPR